MYLDARYILVKSSITWTNNNSYTCTALRGTWRLALKYLKIKLSSSSTITHTGA